MATEAQQQQYSEQNNAMFNQANILSLRLDTEPILERVRDTLGAKRVLLSDAHGNYTEELQLKENARANIKGIEQLMAFVSAIVNPQVVQGNFDEGEYRYYIANVREDLATEVFIHSDDWNISDNDHEFIVDSILNLVKPFISRLKFNKERDSYSATLRHVESNTQSTGSKFNLFSR